MSDLVYIYKKTKAGEIELRYSLRSAALNLTFDRIFLVGDDSSVASERVIRIPCLGPADKYQNAFTKLLAAAQAPDVSETFILMNDDFFTMRTVPEVTPWTDGTISALRDRIPESRRGAYWKSIVDTIRLIGPDTPSFALHAPFPMEKKKLIALAEKYQLPGQALQVRTLYAHDDGIRGTPMEDHKARTMSGLRRWEAGPFLSTTDELAVLPGFKKFIDARFPDKCSYEK